LFPFFRKKVTVKLYLPFFPKKNSFLFNDCAHGKPSDSMSDIDRRKRSLRSPVNLCSPALLTSPLCPVRKRVGPAVPCPPGAAASNRGRPSSLRRQSARSLHLPPRTRVVTRAPGHADAEQRQHRRPVQGQHAADARRPHLEPGNHLKPPYQGQWKPREWSSGQVRPPPAANSAAGEVQTRPGTQLLRLKSVQGDLCKPGAYA
jgi:hypothetical protein